MLSVSLARTNTERVTIYFVSVWMIMNLVIGLELDTYIVVKYYSCLVAGGYEP